MRRSCQANSLTLPYTPTAQPANSFDFLVLKRSKNLFQEHLRGQQIALFIKTEDFIHGTPTFPKPSRATPRKNVQAVIPRGAEWGLGSDSGPENGTFPPGFGVTHLAKQVQVRRHDHAGTQMHARRKLRSVG